MGSNAGWALLEGPLSEPAPSRLCGQLWVSWNASVLLCSLILQLSRLVLGAVAKKCVCVCVFATS